MPHSSAILPLELKCFQRSMAASFKVRNWSSLLVLSLVAIVIASPPMGSFKPASDHRPLILIESRNSPAEPRVKSDFFDESERPTIVKGRSPISRLRILKKVWRTRNPVKLGDHLGDHPSKSSGFQKAEPPQSQPLRRFRRLVDRKGFEPMTP